jgi:hypothetical protein
MPVQKFATEPKMAWRVAWQLAKSALSIAAVIGIYRLCSTGFETMAASVLIGIYILAALSASRTAIDALSLSHKNDLQFLELKKLLLGKGPSYDERDAVQVAESQVANLLPAVYIHQSALGIIDCIALWHLAKAIGWF